MELDVAHGKNTAPFPYLSERFLDYPFHFGSKTTLSGKASCKFPKCPRFILGNAFEVVFNFTLFTIAYVCVLHQVLSFVRAGTQLFLFAIMPWVLLQFFAYSRCSIVTCCWMSEWINSKCYSQTITECQSAWQRRVGRSKLWRVRKLSSRKQQSEEGMIQRVGLGRT